MLTYDSGRGNILAFGNYKSKRVILSVLSGEIYAFFDCFDIFYTLRNDLKRVLGRSVPIWVICSNEATTKDGIMTNCSKSY